MKTSCQSVLRARRLRPTWALVLLWVGLAACRRNEPPPISACPTLTLGAWEWFGVIGPPGTVAPNERLTLREEGGEPLAHGLGVATAEGSFALRGARRSGSGRLVVLETASGQRFSVRAGRTEARIDYAPEALAVTEGDPGTMTFHGWLAATPTSSPIERAWAASWATGAVAPIDPTPRLGIPISGATVRGSLGECMTIFSQHTSGGTGGCWWPRPGGCLCRHCTADELAAGSCVEPAPLGEDPTCQCEDRPRPDASAPGPLPARERFDRPSPARGDPPPPFYGTSPEPEPAYPDAGRIDAGPEEPPS
ncbi:MAG: hypothetical protein ACK6CU_09460 [Deltaproteobacteria bacterium]